LGQLSLVYLTSQPCLVLLSYLAMLSWDLSSLMTQLFLIAVVLGFT